MAIHDFNAQRLYVDAPLDAGRRLRLTAEQANYLVNVLRMSAGATILVFNGRDGEWSARLEAAGRRDVDLVVAARSRPQETGPDIQYLFAPLKRARLDYMVQKAVEMGAARLSPVMTRRTVAERVNVERMRANAIEAAEQCGILHLPVIDAPQRLDRILDAWDGGRTLIFCDEAAERRSPVLALDAALRERASPERAAPPLALLIGPEGGFADEERARLAAVPGVIRLSLGPRIMRADTAAVAAFAVLQAVAGDWR